MVRVILLCYFVLFTYICHAKNFTISGFVKDKQNDEALIGAYCFDSLTFKGNTTNLYGFYSLTLPAGKVKLVISFSGYKPEVKEFILSNDTLINFSLDIQPKEIKEVVVQSQLPIHRQTIMGKTVIPIKSIEAIPSFIGIPDIMKAISFIPGVSTGKEGYSNIYVRGGDRGQNLILLDGAKLYNSNHVGGFVSLFNPNIVKQVEIYKGGFPARYGGRASSVIYVHTKEGTSNKLRGKFQIGILNSGFVLETPVYENLSCMVAGRTSYYDLLTLPARRSFKQTKSGSYYGYTFFDINTKITWTQSMTNKFFVSAYTGHDIQQSEEAQKASFQETERLNSLKIHNTSITVGQNSSISPKIFVKNTIAFSNYANTFYDYWKDYKYGSTNIEKFFSYSKINDYTLQSRWEFYPNTYHSLMGGIEISRYQFIPGLQSNFKENTNTENLLDTTIGFTSPLISWEYNIYFEDEIHLSDKIWINIGARHTTYYCSDTTYFRFEPRVSFRWLINELLSFKANYTIMNQFNHVLVNNYYGFEKEIWIAATKNLPPQNANQMSVGLFFNKNALNISVEGFYKKMRNLLEYRSPVDQNANLSNIENIIAQNGIGEAYGLETQISHESRIFKTNVSYALSWNNRKFE
ncbi:MAG TPA: TonB-dependent receptor [Bacteroidales bacterium]|nr:TonB-dependent receptor [Bacteroidales bacterium]HPO66327.1 TonB-dependent receptor [Bacteroidales bacterium]